MSALDVKTFESQRISKPQIDEFWDDIRRHLAPAVVDHLSEVCRKEGGSQRSSRRMGSPRIADWVLFYCKRFKGGTLC